MDNFAAAASHDAITTNDNGELVGFSRKWTRRAVQVLRNAARNPFIHQARNEFGGLDENGHGTACATQVLYDLLDSLRTDRYRDATLDKILPITVDRIIDWNDSDELSYDEIADRIISEAGGPMALYRA